LAGLLALFAVLTISAVQSAASESWEKLDKRLKGQIYQINVGLKLRLKNGGWAQLSDLSPKYRYPVFSTTADDKGFRVVGFGTAFPIKALRNERTYFITNRHVVDSSEPIIKECERFFAAMRLYAEQTATTSDGDRRFRELQSIVNLAGKKEMSGAEKATYQATVDAIWDTYETYLSVKADPGRILFPKYLSLVGVDTEIGYFLHAPGPVTLPALQALPFKVAKADGEPDLALLTVSGLRTFPLEFDAVPPTEGQEIQVIGYPAASEQIDVDASRYYSPTFNTGRISRIAPHILQVDAPITKGNSGGPVISHRGKVLGVVAVRALSDQGGELPNFGGAITIKSIKAFAPELFDKLSSR
jgi:S1-C subfamily serine protease